VDSLSTHHSCPMPIASQRSFESSQRMIGHTPNHPHRHFYSCTKPLSFEGMSTPTSAPERLLAVNAVGLTKRFGERTVVDQLDLTIPAGSVCGFVGPNGAGKTTTIRMLLGLIRPTSGSGSILGGDLSHPETYLHKVGALIESPAFYPSLSGRDNLLLLARLGDIRREMVSTVLSRVGLLERSVDPYRTYSLGMKQRLGLAAALLPSPELLILDEPTNGLDPAGIVEMRELIRSLAEGGIAIFISSHLLAEIEHICDHLVMISEGRTVFQGEVAGLRATQNQELVIRPEKESEVASLMKLVRENGFTARSEELMPGLSAIIVQAPPEAGSVLNRMAMSHDIALAHLSERTRSLEEAYFDLTGSHSRDTMTTPALGGIK
jgi:ABC-2 type transport system ATP-binding protein